MRPLLQQKNRQCATALLEMPPRRIYLRVNKPMGNKPMGNRG